MFHNDGPFLFPTKRKLAMGTSSPEKHNQLSGDNTPGRALCYPSHGGRPMCVFQADS